MSSAPPIHSAKKHLGMITGFKALRVPILYVSLMFTNNLMENIYTEKTIVNGEDPPALTNFLWLFLVIDFLLNVIVILMIILLYKFNVLPDDFYMNYIIDYLISMVVILAACYVFTMTVQDRKYFLYNEDGLRAIRALRDTVFMLASILTLIPYEFMIKALANGVPYVLSLQDYSGAAAAAAAPAQ